MKKLIITFSIIFGMCFSAMAQDNFAQQGGGLFQRGDTPNYNFFADWADLGWVRDGALLGLPSDHGLTDDQSSAPLGSGIALLAALGGAYLVAKRRKEE